MCTVKDSHGKPVEGVKADIWETNSSGRYDVQYADRDGPDGRVVIKSKDDGSFWFKAIKPVPYPIPHDGPVGKLLEKLRRHPYRPSHMHFMFEKPGYDHLITWVLPSTMWVEQAIDSRGNRALYLRGDPYETSDAVFGVKESLLVDLEPADVATAEQYSVKPGTQVLKYDFVLVPDEEANDLRDEESRKALAALGRRVQILDGLPVPDVD